MRTTLFLLSSISFVFSNSYHEELMNEHKYMGKMNKNDHIQHMKEMSVMPKHKLPRFTKNNNYEKDPEHLNRLLKHSRNLNMQQTANPGSEAKSKNMEY